VLQEKGGGPLHTITFTLAVDEGAQKTALASGAKRKTAIDNSVSSCSIAVSVFSCPLFPTFPCFSTAPCFFLSFLLFALCVFGGG